MNSDRGQRENLQLEQMPEAPGLTWLIVYGAGCAIVGVFLIVLAIFQAIDIAT